MFEGIFQHMPNKNVRLPAGVWGLGRSFLGSAEAASQAYAARGIGGEPEAGEHRGGAKQRLQAWREEHIARLAPPSMDWFFMKVAWRKVRARAHKCICGFGFSQRCSHRLGEKCAGSTAWSVLMPPIVSARSTGAMLGTYPWSP